MATQKVKWAMEADYLQACNCDSGCPCEFEAPPTQGNCDGAGAWRINRGHYGDISLDGLGFGFAARWPGALHLGNGTAVLFFDEKANEQQRDALMKIATGQAGGMPFEIIVTTLSKVLEPQYVPFQFEIKGRNSSVKIGDAVSVALEPIKNPLSGQPDEVHVERPAGILFKSAEIVATKENRSNVPGLTFSNLNRNSAIAQVKYGN
jgi:hypothetical protein